MADNTHPVRVVIREVTYAKKSTNILDQPVVVFETAYGPGRPEIDVATRLGTDVDPESHEYTEAMKDFQMGQLIEVLDDDYVRLINGGAVVDAAAREQQVAEAEENAVDVSVASVDDLAAWIKEEQPTVQQTVDASDGDPDIARKLLEAESAANDGEPRKGVVDGLTAVIARG